MITKPHLLKTFDVLGEGKTISVHLHGFAVSILSESMSKLSLKTAVFSGNSYIPPSVRSCAEKNNSSPTTFLSIDEELFSVYLHSKVPYQTVSYEALDVALENFVVLARNWQQRLDDFGQQDLVPVGVLR